MARVVGHIGLSVFHNERIWVNWLDIDKKKIPVPEVGSGRYYLYNELPDDPRKGGAGIILGEISRGFVGGIDLDGCLIDGELAGWAAAIVEEIGSYTEVSPSGLGVKIFFIMKTAGMRLSRKQVQWPKHSSQSKAWGIEAYVDGNGTRFFTTTGRVYGSCREVVEVSARKLKWVGERMKEFESAGKSLKRVIKAMGYLRNEDLSWEEWNNIGMALYNASLGGPAGKEVWIEFSRKSSKFEMRECLARWEHWKRSPADNIGLNYIERFAAKFGYEIEDDIADKYDCRKDIEDLNKNHAHIKFGKRMFILLDKPGLDNWTLYDIMEEKHWRAFMMGFTNRVGNDLRPVHEIWLDSRYRRQYDGVGLYPPEGVACPETYYNLWRGWKVVPQKPALVGGWERFKQHLFYVICSGNVDYWRYLRRWLAYKIQNPGKKIGVAIVLRGEKGIGKTVVADYLRCIFGAHFVRVSQQKHLLGNFNAHLEHALLVNAEEAFWAGSKQAEGVLKDLITSDTMLVERKGVDAYTTRNLIDILITSNADWVVPASHDERRYFVLDASSEKMGDVGYFKALFNEMEGGGPGAMLFDLLNEDLGDFNPRVVQSTDSLWDQKLITMSSYERYVYELAIEGRVPGMDSIFQVVKSYLHSRYQDRSREVGARDIVNDIIFCKFLYKLGCWKSRPRINGEQVTAIQFPSLKDFRATLDKHFGHVGDWDDKENWFVFVEGEKRGNLDFER